MPKPLLKADIREIDLAVAAFESRRHDFQILAKALVSHLEGNPQLAPFIHFIKYRVKEPSHLRDKLVRKARERRAAGKAPDITVANLFAKIHDLAGVRILHLHTEQIGDMAKIIDTILDEYFYKVVEGPKAICWDLEYEALFKSLGITAESRNSMYTSVHYTLRPNQRTPLIVELQVRTMMEEVWGEVSHRVDYPNPMTSRAGKDQLRVLARLTSGCTRLVDSIFRSAKEE